MVSDSPPDNVEHGAEISAPCPDTQRFYDAFPYYLAIGMTAEQYWDDDPSLARYYRKADEMRNERRNQELWLQGMYIYEALCDVAPVLQAFAKKGTKVRPYPSAPYAITDKARERERENDARKMSDKGKRYMQAIMTATNKRFSVHDEL